MHLPEVEVLPVKPLTYLAGQSGRNGSCVDDIPMMHHRSLRARIRLCLNHLVTRSQTQRVKAPQDIRPREQLDVVRGPLPIRGIGEVDIAVIQ